MSLDVYVHPLDDDEDVSEWLDEEDDESPFVHAAQKELCCMTESRIIPR